MGFINLIFGITILIKNEKTSNVLYLIIIMIYYGILKIRLVQL